MSAKFTRNVRLTTKAQYNQVFDCPHCFLGKYWKVLAKDTKQATPRLGLAVSKKVLDRAVDRNTYKRIAREVFRLNQTKLATMDFVVMAKQKTNKRKELHLELLQLLRCAHDV